MEEACQANKSMVHLVVVSTLTDLGAEAQEFRWRNFVNRLSIAKRVEVWVFLVNREI
jgi:hypothetical protein